MIAAAILSAVALATPTSSAHAQLYTQRVLTGLNAPTYLTAPRNQPNALYVTEQGGLIRVAVGGKLRARPFLDLRRLVSSGGERGLLSMAFHPNYAKNHLFYVSYTDRNGNSRVVQYRSNGSVGLPATAKRILYVKQPYPNHNGGQLQFGPDGLLYFGLGDGGSEGDPNNIGQRLTGTKLSKLLRINPTRRGATWQVVAYGLRNPWRFSFDRETGDLWIGDVGQDTWEEIDFRPRALIGKLANYGWSVFEGRARYKSVPLNRHGQLVAPVTVYHHGPDCSVTGGYVYRGSAVPAAVGRYFFGDYCSGHIWSLTMSGGTAQVRREPFDVGYITSFGEDARGELYFVSGGGDVYRLVP